MLSLRNVVIVVFLAVGACTGADGADGISELAIVQPEPAGTNCPSGGVAILSGIDTNHNGKLDASEVASTQYVCSGGVGVLSTVTPEPAGANCAAGGVRIDNGADTNDNHVLDPSEITSTSYVCGAGAAQVIKVDAPATVVAANTGTAVTVLSAPITTAGAGKLLAISNVDAYCAAATCPAGNPAADGTLWLSLVDTETVPPADYEYFFLSPNVTSTVSRTQDFAITAAGTYTVYMRGFNTTHSFSFYRPSVTLVFLP